MSDDAEIKEAKNFLMTDEERYQAEMNVLVQELSGMLGHLSADALAKAYATADQRISHIRQGQIEELRGLIARTKSDLSKVLDTMQEDLDSPDTADPGAIQSRYYNPLVDISVRLNP